MRVEIEKSRIILYEPEFFNIKDILECGQVFRFQRRGEGDYFVYSLDKRAHVYDDGGRTIIDCGDGRDTAYFYNYFDLGTDYGAVRGNLARLSLDNAAEHDFLSKAMETGRGIRILRQDKAEVIISFIISANNNIKRIQGIIERLCAAAGENMGEYYAFPTVSALAKLSKKFYNDIGAGYRDAYLYETVRALDRGFDLDAVNNADTHAAEKLLSGLMGVGPKVANCILLFGFNKFGAFPVDTWIEKVFTRFYGDIKDRRRMQRLLTDRYGGLSGYAQQYLFYYARESARGKDDENNG